MSTKWLVVLVSLVVLVVGGSQVKAWFDSQQAQSFVRGYDQAKAFYKPEAPKIVSMFADGLCHGNQDELIASTSPNGDINEDDATAYVETYVSRGRTCKQLLFKGSFERTAGNWYFYVIDTSGNPLWYILTADETGVLQVQ